MSQTHVVKAAVGIPVTQAFAALTVLQIHCSTTWIGGSKWLSHDGSQTGSSSSAGAVQS